MDRKNEWKEQRVGRWKIGAWRRKKERINHPVRRTIPPDWKNSRGLSLSLSLSLALSLFLNQAFPSSLLFFTALLFHLGLHRMAQTLMVWITCIACRHCDLNSRRLRLACWIIASAFLVIFTTLGDRLKKIENKTSMQMIDSWSTWSV